MRSRIFTNVKMGTTVSNGVVGPQALTGSNVYMTQMIPCRGAKMVFIKYKSTDANVPIAVGGGNVFSGSTGVGQALAAGSLAVNVDPFPSSDAIMSLPR